jgi:hypothetical protein
MERERWSEEERKCEKKRLIKSEGERERER